MVNNVKTFFDKIGKNKNNKKFILIFNFSWYVFLSQHAMTKIQFVIL
jgi:hypothetical protein